MVGHGLVDKVDGVTMQATFSSGESKRELLHIQHYGFKSITPKGSAFLSVGNGERRDPVVIATKAKDEPDLKEGESAIFSKDAIIKASGSKVHIGNKSSDIGGIIDELIEALLELSTSLSVPNGGQVISAPDKITKIRSIQAKWQQLTKA